MRNILLFAALLLSVFSKAQNPVTWNYWAKKISDKTYEIHIASKIQKGWHLYSQLQPADAIAIPTNIIFGKNPIINLNGKVKEIGKLEKYKEPTLGIEQWHYSDKVEFVQTITLKANVGTKISGNIEYQVCTNEKCLPPKMIQFSVDLNGK